MPGRALPDSVAEPTAVVASPRPRPVGIVVAGMHRSGTSALTRAINLLGADLPKDLLGATANNPLGHWEPRRIYELQQALFKRMDSNWDGWEPLPPGWLQSSAAERAAHDVADFLVDDFSGSDLFVVKEPRVCRFLPVWKRAFEIAEMDMRIVMPLRRPTEVARSLSKRNGMSEMRGLFIWLRYVLDAEKGSRGEKRAVLSYEDLLADWPSAMRRLGQDIDVVWPRWTRQATAEVAGFLSPEHRHHVDSSTDLSTRIDLPVWIGQAWGALTQSRPAEPDQKALDAINAAFSAAADPFARLVAGEVEAANAVAERQRHVLKGEKGVLAQRVEELEAANTAAKERGDKFKEKWKADQSTKDAAIARAASAEQRVGELEAFVERRTAEATEARNLFEQSESARQAADAKLSALVTESATRLDNQRAELDALREAAEAQAAIAQAQAAAAEIKVRELSEALDASQAELRDTQEALAATRSQLADVERQRRQLADALDSTQAELQDVQKALAASRSQIAAAETKGREASEALDASQAELRDAQEALVVTRSQILDAEARAEDLRIAAKSANKRANGIEAAGVAATEAAVAGLAKALGEARAAIVSLSGERDQLLVELEQRVRAA